MNHNDDHSLAILANYETKKFEVYVDWEMKYEVNDYYDAVTLMRSAYDDKLNK